MPKPIFNAIESGDLAALEAILEKGTSPVTENEEGVHPLTYVATYIDKYFNEGRFEKEDLYKKMAAMLIVHGAPDADLMHAFGEVSNLRRYTCRYIVDLSAKKRSTEDVVTLIKEKSLWFSNNDKALEANFLTAVEKGECERIEAMFENDQVHFAFEQ